MSLSPLVLVLLGAGSAALGAFGGLGGATLLVPVLLLFDVDPLAAAPLGLMTVAAGSLAAAARQLDEGLVHHRLGVSVELAASVGTVAGALVATSIPGDLLAVVLGAAAFAGGVAALARRGVRDLAPGAFEAEATHGEWPGTLGGQYPHAGHTVPYQATHVPAGMALSVVAGAIAGVSGVGGGFIKTPAMTEIMDIPVKVAAATTTFTLGITSSTGLVIFALQGRITVRDAAAVVAGSLFGGWVGARLQSRVATGAARRVTGVLLVVVALVVIGRTL